MNIKINYINYDEKLFQFNLLNLYLLNQVIIK